MSQKYTAAELRAFSAGKVALDLYDSLQEELYNRAVAGYSSLTIAVPSSVAVQTQVTTMLETVGITVTESSPKGTLTISWE